MKLTINHKPHTNNKVVAIYNQACETLVLPVDDGSGDCIMITKKGNIIKMTTSFSFEIQSRKVLPEMTMIYENDEFSYQVSNK